MDAGDLYKVGEIKTLEGKPEEEEARKILDRVAKQVQPILCKHKWRVEVLSEFYPTDSSHLWSTNGGGVIRLRLRWPYMDWVFLSFNEVLDIMLRALCHNVFILYSASFVKLWIELRKECDELLKKGITGTGKGFDLPGNGLGGFSRQPPLSSLRQTALSAAEKGVRRGSLLRSGPKHLGGDSSIMAALTPVQAAALAAERRYQDELWCGSKSSEVDKEGEKSIDLIQKNGVHITGSSRSNPQKRSRLSSTGQMSQTSNGRIGSSFSESTDVTSVSRSTLDHDAISYKRTRQVEKNASRQSRDGYVKPIFIDLSTEASTSESAFIQDKRVNTGESMMWECYSCTLLNLQFASICELCSSQKPEDVEEKYKVWGCKFCTLENSVKLDKCKACGQWRYSHGPPLAAPPLDLDT